ncbi:ABC transporter ATP-binding protein [Sporosarcina limicola]|uniref:ABC-2 type transport system ATP-binding protein n=1 Tax=Sporosarcina limicola TaxID=34101 RepID=A0A927MRE0_9BACL|nr:ABC transporter ATP-binding protein [Sporosarcina limicola]MBE1555971.1 ABC-2 type transport system ATP-binding protein [Sporosarcina limicola]
MKLEVKTVTKEFKGKIAVKNFSMAMQSGECVGLIGPNGAGKSTLLKMIADIIDPSDGEIVIDGKKIMKMKKEIGYLPQYPNFYQWMSAQETLRFMGELSGLSKDHLTKAIPKILSRVGLSKDADSKVGSFSGGMKQRLGIAQALLHKPSLLLMDEPVSALDPIGRREVLNLINDIKKETTILFSTHLLGDAEEICDRFIIIKNGEKIEDATIMDLLSRNDVKKISVEVASKNEQWIKAVKEFNFVKNVEVLGNKVEIEVENVQLNKKKLLESVLEHHVDLVKFEIKSGSLEDIFLKLVVEK